MLVARSLFPTPTHTNRLSQAETATQGPRWITTSKIDLGTLIGFGVAALLIGGTAYLLIRKPK